MAQKERSQIDPAYTWDLSSMFADDKAFEASFADAQSLPDALAAARPTALSSAEDLLAYLKLEDKVETTLSKLANYAERRHDEDTRVALYQDFSSRVTDLASRVSRAGAWFAPALLALSPDTVEGFYKAEPELELYRRKLDKIVRMRAHVLPADREALLAAAEEMAVQPENIFSMLNDADMTFPDALDSQDRPHQVTHGTYIPLMMSGDRTLRENAFASLYGTYRQFRNTSAAVLGAQTRTLKFFAQARHYENRPGVPASLEASLFPTEVPVDVYLNLISTVRDNMGSMYRYVDLRRRLLGVDELHYWDLYAPMIGKVDMKFTFEQACDIMLQALAPLGDDYLAIVQKALDERWVDVYENTGKRSGAYSAGGYGMHPVILLNFQGTLDDVFTLVHEMGHSVHTYLACENQPPAYSDYEMFVAEVASTCNENLLMQWFLDHTQDDDERAYLLNHWLEQFRTTLYRQCMFAEFERDVNELAAQGAGVTADALCKRYAELNHVYFGDGIAADEGISYEWARIPHFYYDYYMYVYATSFAAATALSQKILAEGKPAVEAYLGFLSSGSSKPPIDLLRGAGVDMATPAPIADALRLFDGLITRLATLRGVDPDSLANS